MFIVKNNKKENFETYRAEITLKFNKRIKPLKDAQKRIAYSTDTGKTASRPCSLVKVCTVCLDCVWKLNTYRKIPKFSDARKLCCKLPNRIFCPKDANGIANSEDPDQTAPVGAVWSGSAVFAQIYMSENLGSLQ